MTEEKALDTAANCTLTKGYLHTIRAAAQKTLRNLMKAGREQGETLAGYNHRCNILAQQTLSAMGKEKLDVLALRRQHRFAGHIARQSVREGRQQIGCMLRECSLRWQDTLAMLDRGKRGHPGRFFAGTNWERQLHAFYWHRGERVWENEAKDRLGWIHAW